MSVYLRGRIYHYEFWVGRQRYRGGTRQTEKAAAEAVEAAKRAEVLAARREQAEGLGPPRPKHSPRIVEWAERYFADAEKRGGDLETLEQRLRVVLRFWGAKPGNPQRWPKPDEEAPFHNLRLADPIRQPQWILQFEDWMARRGSAPHTRNRYRSALSQLYKHAMRPAYRALTGVTLNPFLSIERDRPLEQTIALEVDQLLAWIRAAPTHTRYAMAVASLAPKLRLQNVLGLRWEHVRRDLSYIEVPDHKTAWRTQRPLVIPVSRELQAILRMARARAGAGCPWVIPYRGRRVHDIRAGLMAAADDAGIAYGRGVGATFHTIRHTMGTLLAEEGVSLKLLQALLGHQHASTTERYLHLRPRVEQPMVDRLAEILPLRDVLETPRRRA